MKKPQDEQQLWAICYSTAAALLTLGASIHAGANSIDPRGIDERAEQIADRAVKRLKGKLP